MSDILIGMDAGTSMIKCAAFSTSGELLAGRSRTNRYDTSPDGAAVQSLPDTRDALIETLSELAGDLGTDRARVRAAAITAQGDGTWLVDENDEALHEGWLWLDSRAAGIAAEIERSARFAAVFATTGTSINASQMRSQMLWMERHQPEILDAAATAYHCKDYLYACLTGARATDPSEGLLSFGDFLRRKYSPDVLRLLDLDGRSHLLPDIVDGYREAHPLVDSVARATGLPAGLPITLGYVDVICSALGGGLYDAGAASAMTLTGTTGIHNALHGVRGQDRAARAAQRLHHRVSRRRVRPAPDQHGGHAEHRLDTGCRARGAGRARRRHGSREPLRRSRRAHPSRPHRRRRCTTPTSRRRENAARSSTAAHGPRSRVSTRGSATTTWCAPSTKGSRSLPATATRRWDRFRTRYVSAAAPRDRLRCAASWPAC